MTKYNSFIVKEMPGILSARFVEKKIGTSKKNARKLRLFAVVYKIPSFYMNVGHFSEYAGHPNNKFQTFLKNSRVQVGVYL